MRRKENFDWWKKKMSRYQIKMDNCRISSRNEKKAASIDEQTKTSIYQTKMDKCNINSPNEKKKSLEWCKTIHKMNDWCFRSWFSTVRAILGRRQPGRMRLILLWVMPLAQDRWLNLLTSSPTRCHCTTDASPKPIHKWQTKNTILLREKNPASCVFWLSTLCHCVSDIYSLLPLPMKSVLAEIRTSCIYIAFWNERLY